MENYPYSYPDSHDSSPRSQNNETWEDQQQQPQSNNYKVKFMISYNGKILPRPHDNQLAYVGGETKILALDRSIRFPAMVAKLSSFASTDEIAFKYQLPGEDLDALISVTNDEDLEHMMAEYDRLLRSTVNSGAKPARLRLFLFPVNNSNQSSFSGDDPKPNQQWFVDALNAVPVSVPDGSSPPASASNPGDFLFGFEKSPGPAPAPSQVAPVPAPLKQEVEKIGSEDRVGENQMYEIHRQIQDLQRLQIQEQKQQQQQLQQAMMQRSNDANMRANYHGDYYIQEKPAPAAAVPVSVAPAGYWQEQRNTPVSGGYSDQITSIERQQQQQHQQHQHNIQQQQQQHQHNLQQQQQQQQQQLYMIHSQAYQTPVTNVTNVRQVAGQVGHTGQGYYGMQPRVVPDVYREQPVYTMGPPQVQQQAHPQMKMMMGEVGGGGSGSGGYTTQVGYDSTGRQVYYATPPAQGGVVPSYQPAVGTDPRQQQESKVVKSPQAS